MAFELHCFQAILNWWHSPFKKCRVKNCSFVRTYRESLFWWKSLQRLCQFVYFGGRLRGRSCFLDVRGETSKSVNKNYLTILHWQYNKVPIRGLRRQCITYRCTVGRGSTSKSRVGVPAIGWFRYKNYFFASHYIFFK